MEKGYKAILSDKLAVLDKLQTLQENDLSKRILKPLLGAIYNCKVDFVGGGPEKGRDLLIYHRDPLGDARYIGVQVKKISPNSNSSDSRSFQQLITQLDQMKSEPVVEPETGSEINLDQLLFVTPYVINQKELDSHKGAYKLLLEKEVKIIDGDKVVNLLDRHAPHLVGEIFDHDTQIDHIISSTLNNQALMRALDTNLNREIVATYCELSFQAGGKHLDRYMNNGLSVNTTDPVISFKGREIEDIGKENTCVSESYALEILTRESSVLLNKLLVQRNVFRNQILRLNRIFEKLAAEVAGYTRASKLKGEIEKVVGCVDPAKISSEDGVRLVEKSMEKLRDNPDVFPEKVRDEVEATIGLCLVRLKQLRRIHRLRRVKSNEIEEQSIELKLEYAPLMEFFLKKRDEIKQRFASGDAGLSEYLDEVGELTQIASHLDRRRQYFSVSFGDEFSPFSSGVNVDLFDIFDTGKNIALLGGAGSGKTTSLQMYAKKKLQGQNDFRVFFATLSDIGECASSESSEGHSLIVSGLSGYLERLSIRLSPSELASIFSRKKSVVILDSIDEAISSFPWIIDALVEFCASFDHLQVITSSRLSIDQVKQIPFVHINLLPLSDAQKEEFFSKWFVEEPDRAAQISRHLARYSHLNSVISNPLSATIMCVLCENNVPLPVTESNLYRSRFDLLSGLFDKHKGIFRLETSSENLLYFVQQLAFRLHENHIKKFDLDFIRIHYQSLKKDDSFGDVETIISDLIRSEIIVAESPGYYDFGHFKFQEYLVSAELVHRRSYKIANAIVDPWWAEVLKLYSQHAHEIEWVVNKAIEYGLVQQADPLLRSMIENRPVEEQAVLNRRLGIAYGDEFDDEAFIYDDYSDRDPTLAELRAIEQERIAD